MHGKKFEEQDFELAVRQFKTPHERGSSIAGNSTSTTALFSKKFNNLFVKNFPKPNYTSEDLQVSKILQKSRNRVSDQIFCFVRNCLSPLVRLSAAKFVTLMSQVLRPTRRRTASASLKLVPTVATASSALKSVKTRGRLLSTSTRSKTSLA